MLYCSVLTTPKRPQYVRATIEALNTEGIDLYANGRFVFVDGAPFFEAPGQWEVHSRPGLPELGVRGSMREIFKIALSKTNCDELLYLEDDVLPAEGALHALPLCRDDQALISLFDNHEFPGAKHAVPGVHDVPMIGRDKLGLFGACALLLPRATMEYALANWDAWEADQSAADQALSWVLESGPWKCRGVAIPSRFEHIGDISSMGHNAGRAAWFEGAR